MCNKTKLSRIKPISKDINTDKFDCGIPVLNEYLEKYAYTNHQAGSSRTYTVTGSEDKVVGFYTLSFGDVSYKESSDRMKKGLGKYPVPVLVLARLAVDKTVQKIGLGAALVKDAVLRAVQASDIAGLRAVLVHAKDDKARTFYEKFGFEPSPVNKFHLYLLIKDIKKIFDGAE